MADLYSIVYVSRSLIEGDLSGQLAALVRQSRSRNARHGLTGALICSPSYFAQIIEGPEAPLEATVERIQRDSRHEDIEVLYLMPIEARQFGNWGMASAGVLLNDDAIRAVLDLMGDTARVSGADAAGHAAMDLLIRTLRARELK